MPETTPLIKAALNLRGGAGFDVYSLTLIIMVTLMLSSVAMMVPTSSIVVTDNK